MARDIRLTPKAEREMEEIFKLQREGLEVLGVIAAEFASDPQSVQCFDLRTVERAQYITARLKKLKESGAWL